MMKIRLMGWEMVIRRARSQRPDLSRLVTETDSLGRKKLATKGRSAL